MTRRTFAIVVLLSLAACSSPAERQATSTNPQIQVSVLTRFEGITLYRVEADGKQIYVARTGEAHGEAHDTTAHWSELVCNPCGKTECCHEEERETTVVAARWREP